MILICYDGSPDATAAIDRCAELLKGQRATVLTVWEPFIEVVTRAYAGFAPVAGMVDQAEIDRVTREHAEQRAEQGASHARDAGLDAEPRTCAQETNVVEAILREADSIDASAILMGSRGLSGLKSVLLGSVSNGVIHRADRPVIVVPSAEVASARHSERAASSDR
jgi:nucleotide-binding universal stress UspA family protein